MAFDFDLKFSFLPVPSAIGTEKGEQKGSTPIFFFEKADKRITYTLRSMSDLQQWR